MAVFWPTGGRTERNQPGYEEEECGPPWVQVFWLVADGGSEMEPRLLLHSVIVRKQLNQSESSQLTDLSPLHSYLRSWVMAELKWASYVAISMFSHRNRMRRLGVKLLFLLVERIPLGAGDVWSGWTLSWRRFLGPSVWEETLEQNCVPCEPLEILLR